MNFQLSVTSPEIRLNIAFLQSVTAVGAGLALVSRAGSIITRPRDDQETKRWRGHACARAGVRCRHLFWWRRLDNREKGTYHYLNYGCLVQVGNGIELEAVLQFEPYRWRPCGVTWDFSRTVVVIKLRRTSALQAFFIQTRT